MSTNFGRDCYRSYVSVHQPTCKTSFNLFQPLNENDGNWVMHGEIEDGKIYQIPFDGTDAHAEAIERATSLTFLGDSTEDYDEEMACHMSGKMTRRRIILAKTY